MAFTRVWDNAFPPDTQLAQLGAQDMREIQENVQERMAGLAVGTLANRQDPEAGFGQPNNGVQYYAYDVGVLYQWDGSSWIARRYDLTLSDINLTAVGGTAETPLNTVVLPAGSVTYGCRIVIDAFCRITGVASNAKMRLYIQSLSVAFDLDWLGTDTAHIHVDMIILGNDGYIADFKGNIGNAGSEFNVPDEQAFDINNACAIGTTIELGDGSAVALGLTAKVSL